jgi:hypothetical protein
MMRSLASPVLTVVLALFVPALARADLVNFSYGWNLSDFSVGTAGSVAPTYGLSSGGSSLSVWSGSGAAVLTLPPSGEASAIPGAVPTTIPAGSLSVICPFNKLPNTNGFTVSFTMNLHVTDLASGGSADLITGREISADDIDGQVKAYTSGYAGFNSSLPIGGHDYTVVVNPTLDWLSPTGDALPLSANIYVDRPLPTPPKAPEPAGIALAIVGVVSLSGLACGRQKRTSITAKAG